MNTENFVVFFRNLIQNPARTIGGALTAGENIYQQPADGHGLSYLNELVTEYRSLAETENNEQARKLIETVLAKIEKQPATWDDINSFELALVKLLPKEKLFKKAWSLRGEYKEIASADDWEAYQSANPPLLDSDKTPVEKVRADAEQLLQELEWLYTTMPTQELQRNELLINIIVSGVLFVIVGIVCVFCLSSPVFGWVFILGTVGAIVSAWQRAQKLPLTSNEEVNLSKLNSYGISAQLAPPIGGGAAVLLTLLFISGLVSGTLFPNVAFKTHPNTESRRSNKSSTNQLDVVNTNFTTAINTNSTNSVAFQTASQCPNPWDYRICVPTGTSWALLLVWSFIAGFSERLVPDIISRLAAKADT